MAPTTHETVRSQSIGSRLRSHFGFKLLILALFGTVFFGGYFLLLKFPLFPVTVMPLTALDRSIGFQPGALLPYVSLWLYVPLVPGLMTAKTDIVAYYRAAFGLCLVGFAFFFFWPTVVPPLEIDWSSAFAHLKAVDGSGNACPSLHVAFAVFSALLLSRGLRQLGDRGVLRGLSWVWCAGIVYSTLATKQHVAIDVVAGAILGTAGAGLHRRRPLQGGARTS